MNTLKEIADHILEHVDDDDRVELAPCREVNRATERCLPGEAQFWTIYAYGMALEDMVSAEAAIAVMGAIWDQRPLEVNFDFGCDVYSCSSIAEALHQLLLLEGGGPAVDTAPAELIAGLAPLREALMRANSNHGRMELAARLPNRADILCFPNQSKTGDPMPLDTRFITLSEGSDTLIAAWLPEAPQRVLITVKSWGPGAARILTVAEARDLAEAIDAEKHVSFEKSEAMSALRTTRDNRGEPYRDGMQIAIDEHSIFLEEGYACETLSKLLRTV